jgi:hypothetical protein
MYSHDIPYHGPFRQLFKPPDWPLISAIFREAFHGKAPHCYFNASPSDTCKARSLKDVLTRVHQNINDRLSHEVYFRDTLLTLLKNLNESKGLAKFLRESEYRQPQPRRAIGFDINAPTAAQLYFLKKNGCKTVPTTKAQASQLITQFKSRRATNAV